MSLNTTVISENERIVPGPGQNVFEINRFRRFTEPSGFSPNANPGGSSGAMIIPFDEILKYKEKKDAVKRLQERTGLGLQDAREVIETLQNKDISLWDVKENQARPRSNRLFWFSLLFAAAGLIWFFKF